MAQVEGEESPRTEGICGDVLDGPSAENGVR